MLLEKKKTVRARWFKADLDSFHEIIRFIEEKTPTLAQISDFLNVGQPKARSLVEYLIMFGVIKLNKARYCLSELYNDIKNILSTEELLEVMYFCFIQNYDLMFWIINDYCSNLISRGIFETNADEIKRDVKYFKEKYNSNVNETNIKAQINRELKLIVNMGNSYNYPLSSLNILEERDNVIFVNRYNKISIKSMSILFFISWKRYFNGITNIKTSEIINNSNFPFCTFFVKDNKAAEILVALERLNIIKIISIADVKHITLNPNITIKDIINKIGEY